MDYIDLTILFDPLSCAWQSLGETDKVRITESVNEILEVLGELGRAQIHTIAKTLDKDYLNTHKRLSTLWTAGKIKKEVIEGKSFHFLPMNTEDKEVPSKPTQPNTYPY